MAQRYGCYPSVCYAHTRNYNTQIVALCQKRLKNTLLRQNTKFHVFKKKKSAAISVKRENLNQFLCHHLTDNNKT